MHSDTKLFIVEDDPGIRYGLVEIFTAEHYAVAACERGDQAEERIAEELPDLIVLDVMLPGKNGYEICRDLRRRGCRVPILMLTAKGQEIDKVVGFDSGADDYVTKPFGVRELVARVQALLRRCERTGNGGGGIGGEGASGFTVGGASVHPDTWEIRRPDGGCDRLTPKEMELLKYFHRQRGRVLSRDDLLDAVWGVRYYGTTRTLDQCVAQLRKKIGDAGPNPRHLITIHGVGYKLEAG